MIDDEMVQKIVDAAETGYPGDRPAQIREVSRAASQLPMGFTGEFLTALKILADRAVAEQQRLD